MRLRPGRTGMVPMMLFNCEAWELREWLLDLANWEVANSTQHTQNAHISFLIVFAL